MNNIFLGFIFILFDFSLTFGESSISLMPTFLGYWFLGKGLAELQEKSATLTKMISWAKGMMIVTAITWILNMLALNIGFIGTIVGVVVAILNIYVTYEVVVGIKEVEQYHQTDIQADKLKTAWMISTVGGILAMVFALIPILGIIGIVVAFVLNVYFAVVMNNVKNAYAAIPPVSSVQEENQNIKDEI